MIKERTKFSARLITALVAAGVEPTQTNVARGFNFRTATGPVTSHAVRKWLVGEAIPTQERLAVFAKWLNVSPQWLRFGEGDSASAGPENPPISHDETILLGNFRCLDEHSKAIASGMIQVLIQQQRSN